MNFLLVLLYAGSRSPFTSKDCSGCFVNLSHLRYTYKKSVRKVRWERWLFSQVEELKSASGFVSGSK